MTNEASPLIDAAHIADLVALDQGRGAMFAQFVDLFLSNVEDRIARLHDHARLADAPALADAAHALRGAAGNVGATAFADLCGGIESAAKVRDLEAAAAAISALEMGYEATRMALVAAVTQAARGA